MPLTLVQSSPLSLSPPRLNPIMGCVSSNFLEEEQQARIVRPGGISNHIVSLTSSTYGILTSLDQTQTPPTSTPPPPPPPPPPPLPPLPRSHSTATKCSTEVINSWELMAGLDPNTPNKSLTNTVIISPEYKERKALRSMLFNSPADSQKRINVLRPINGEKRGTHIKYLMESFEKRCPPGGSQAAVLYTTTLRGIRKTFEECNAVREALDGLGFWIRERDVSMDLGFREELRELMKGSSEGPTVPRLFIKGRHIGGAKIVLQLHEEGKLAGLMEGLPKAQFNGCTCDGCGGMRFLPCFQCSGSRKIVVALSGECKKGAVKGKVLRCMDCNENGLVLCPICS